MFGGPGEGTAVKILPAAIHRGENVPVKSKNNITHSILPYFSSFQRRVVKYIHIEKSGRRQEVMWLWRNNPRCSLCRLRFGLAMTTRMAENNGSAVDALDDLGSSNGGVRRGDGHVGGGMTTG